MEMEMKMRARDDTVVAQDLIPSIPPIAAALHDRFLTSHCSACFRSLQNSQNTPPPCTACDASISHCSLTCHDSDAELHTSSGECLVIRLLSRSDPSTWRRGDSSDLRTALRLLRSLETLGLLDTNLPRRIGCLSADNLDAVLGEGSESEMGERIREGAALMRRVREAVEGVREEEVLWAVVTNAVEVQVSEGAALGVAVYGPWFSWFNHSCSPNACYRFELSSSMPESSFDLDSFRVLPASNGEVPQMVWKRSLASSKEPRRRAKILTSRSRHNTSSCISVAFDSTFVSSVWKRSLASSKEPRRRAKILTSRSRQITSSHLSAAFDSTFVSSVCVDMLQEFYCAVLSHLKRMRKSA